MASFFITGASRGLGQELVRELVTRPASEVSKVIASARGNSPALEELVKNSAGRVAVVQLDVTNKESIKKAVVEAERILGGRGLDILINNAGICQYAAGGAKSMENLQENFTINVFGVHWVTQEFLPLLRKGNMKKVANMTTSLASTTLARDAMALPAPAYKISKAAMNALTVQYALDHEKEGFSFIALCPGWLKTDIGGGDMADLTAAEGAKASLDLIFKPGQELNGQMPKVLVRGWENKSHKYDGTNVPW
ncbi:hypothetical protein QQS21_000253 [Conoideocrella luteorostrata]|uniref:NAD(P)-binding protein n=1 Tax=Conoideocrella luteorostrata TaxID=1105319 RepID=A0AAJ0D1K8_9HYPO|nr:hypothetical protein QQS21_000253 [Conoideocrella luteorostrata]